MAQHKYDLVTVPTKPTGPPRHHPWYKERLDLKFSKHGHKSGCLDGHRWTLLAGNMDDFRTGLPAPKSHTAMVVKRRVHPIPLVDSSKSLQSHHVGTTGQSHHQKKLPSLSPQHNSGHSTLHSKVGPQRQSKMARLRQLEDRLLQHPLSLYPHLQESIPSEIAGDVMAVLGNGSLLESKIVPREDSTFLKHAHKVQEKMEDSNSERGEEGEVSVYRWPLKRTEEEVKAEEVALAEQKIISPAQEARVDEVTHNLVQWGRELGGSEESADVDEATVKSLFTNDYETRPMTAPIRVVEFPNVPVELRSPRMSAGSRRSSPWEMDERMRGRRRLTTPPLPYYYSNYDGPRYVKSRYGAWYLPTSLWTLQRVNEPLCDPRNLTSESAEELAQKDEELNDKVSQLHGAQAFRDYYAAHKPGASVPMFLQYVAANTSSQNLYSSSRHKR